MFVSTGLALTAEAVRSSNGKFEFLTVEEIQADCPLVRVIDADELISPSCWLRCLEDIGSQSKVSVVVAHRETIRNLARRHFSTPYCCMGIVSLAKNNQFEVIRVFDKGGSEIPLPAL